MSVKIKTGTIASIGLEKHNTIFLGEKIPIRLIEYKKDGKEKYIDLTVTIGANSLYYRVCGPRTLKETSDIHKAIDTYNNIEL